MTAALARLRQRPPEWTLALLMAIALAIVNLVALPASFSGSSLPGTVGTLAPLAILAMANTPSILVGGGGIDLSLAPLMGLSNALLVKYLLPGQLGSPVLAIAAVLLVGAAVGAVNGVLVARLRYPPVIATLCTYFVLTGVLLQMLPSPIIATPNWTDTMTTTVAHVPVALVAMGAPLLLWWALTKTPLYENFAAAGDADSAAYSAGVPVSELRILAYAMGGAMAAFAGVALTGMVQEADTSLFSSYILIGLASVALGGTNLAGGRGGLLGSALGALSIFLLGNALVALRLSPFSVQAAYGLLLLVAIVAGSRLGRTRPESVVAG